MRLSYARRPGSLFDDAKQYALLRPVMVLCGSESHRDRDVEAELMRKAGDDLAASVIGIHRYWRDKRGVG